MGRDGQLMGLLEVKSSLACSLTVHRGVVADETGARGAHLARTTLNGELLHDLRRLAKLG